MCSRCKGEIRFDEIRLVNQEFIMICDGCKQIIADAEKERNDISYRRKNASV